MSTLLLASATNLVHIVLDLALSQGLVESVAQGQVVLVLGTGQELIQLVGARILCLLLLGRGSVLLHGSRSGLLLLHLLVAASAEHTSHCVSNSVSLER